MYLIGFFSKRHKFHIVEQRDTMEEVEAYLNNHDYGHFNKLVVFQQVSRPTPHATDLLLPCGHNAVTSYLYMLGVCSVCNPEASR